ncbi:unnamed protein product [Nippostrongylus brasiliensis]|uniref:Uncharacterized protein n=1 Tax=Nippostrongylus brasiliensis TaxID=27835 RepID=A0A0N4YNC7_NIPBR|nr:unnamed protein product [Nippostrongylus brasiliensis]
MSDFYQALNELELTEDNLLPIVQALRLLEASFTARFDRLEAAISNVLERRSTEPPGRQRATSWRPQYRRLRRCSLIYRLPSSPPRHSLSPPTTALPAGGRPAPTTETAHCISHSLLE